MTREPLHLHRAIDLYLGELARRAYSPRTRDDYRRKLWQLADQLGDRNVTNITPDDCRRFLDRWQGAADGTIAHSVTTLARFFAWLYDDHRIDRNPMDRIHRPRLTKPEDLDVTTITSSDVMRLFDACRTWNEMIVISLLAYLGPRRNAASRLRRRDFDFERATIRFREKRRKVIEKPVPDELLALLVAADEAGALGTEPGDYLIPMERAQRRQGERDNRFVWRIVRRVAERAGVEAHPHALRAAFAVHYLETHPERIVALQALMGHEKLETTRVYLRKLDRAKAMETVRDLSWQAPVQYEALADKARSGFEPLYEELQGVERHGTEHDDLSVALQWRAVLARLRDTDRDRS